MKEKHTVPPIFSSEISSSTRIEKKKSGALLGLLVVAAIAGTTLIQLHVTSFHSFPPILKKGEQINEYMESVSFHFSSRGLGISVLDFCGSVLVCRKYRDGISHSKTWFEALVACTFSQFGGTTLTGVILGQTPSWILSHTAFPALLLAYWLTFFAPFDLFYTITSKKFILFCFGFGAAVSSGHAITSWGTDKAMHNQFHNNSQRIALSMLTCLSCGTLSGCGGGIMSDWLGFLRKTSFTVTSTPGIFTQDYKAAATLNRSFLLACLYYILISPNNLPWDGALLTRTRGHLVIGLLQVFNFLIQAIDPSIDVFLFLSYVLLALFGIKPIINPPNRKGESSSFVSESAHTQNSISEQELEKPSNSKKKRNKSKKVKQT